MKIAIVDYGYANIQSVRNAFECFDCTITIAQSPDCLAEADKIVMPGVGSFDAALRGLYENDLISVLNERVLGRRVPFLGICLGLQVLFEESEEGDTPGLGWFVGALRRFPVGENHFRVPHIGWNEANLSNKSRLFQEIGDTADFYFAHSYYVPLDATTLSICAARTSYGLEYVSAIEKDNIFAVQFHPEKSQLPGMKLIQNFLSV